MAAYYPVSVQSLDEGVRLDCDLYIRHPRGELVLYLAREAPFGGMLRRDLRERSVKALWVRDADAPAFTHYVLSRMTATLADGQAPTTAKAAVAYEGVSFLVDRVFADPRAEIIGEMERGVKQTVDLALRESEAARTLMALTRHDAYTYNHSMNVSIFGVALALAVGPNTQWKHIVARGLFLHDIGKTRVPQAIINAPGKLMPEQWMIMKKHPEWGFELLQQANRTNPIILQIALQHHERNDGRGYPLGLPGSDISFEAKVCTISDVFDALTTDRSYRRAMPIYDGLRVMIDEMKREFDSDLFEAFVRLFAKRGGGRPPEATTTGV